MPGADHPSDVVDVPALAGRDHRHPTEPVAQSQIRVRRQQRLEHRNASGHAGHQPGAVLLVVLGVRVCPEHDEQPGHVDLVGGRCQQKGGAPAAVPRFDGCAGAERDDNRICITVLGGGQQQAAGLLDGEGRCLDRGGQCGGDGLEAAGFGVLERGAAVTGYPGHVSATGDQRANRVDVSRSTVAVDDGLVQRRPLRPIHVVDLDARLQQPSDDVGVTPLGRPDQPGPVGRNPGWSGPRRWPASAPAGRDSPRWWRSDRRSARCRPWR